MVDKECIKTDFLIIGTGIAGLYTAYNLSELGQIIVLTKEEIKESNTQYAQGGIAAVLDKGDSIQEHVNDTLEAGAGLCDREAVEVLVKEGPERVKELIELGTDFDHIEGKLDLTREGAHSKRRILHARGDATGEEIRESLTSAVKKKDNIELREEAFMIDLITSDLNPKQLRGIKVWNNKKNKYQIYQSNYIILATGGCGRVYKTTSNPEVATGDGVAAAYRAGVEIRDMEFIQFHPTTLCKKGSSPFLISESVRGEGGVLRNISGKRFMPEYHELADLAPRDVVSRAIVEEIRKKNNKPYVWLDVTELNDDFVKERFPTIFNKLRDHGIDMRKDYIPVQPAAHYMMGGIKSDLNGRTSLQGLYTCGEVACTGVHGANRLASNSLLEGLVFGYRIYKDIKNSFKKAESTENLTEINSKNLIFDNCFSNRKKGNKHIQKIKDKIQEKMMDNAGIIRTGDNLKEFLNWINIQIENLDKSKGITEDYWELKNMLFVAKLITISALKREESRGGHYRKDYPETEDFFKDRHIIFNDNHPEGKLSEFK